MGRVFVGKTGAELDKTYLPLAGLSRSEVYIANVVRCRLGGTNDQPSDEQVRACASCHIADEIASVEPEVLVLLGATPSKLIPGIEIEKDHGLPRWVNAGDSEYLGGWSGWCWPMYHPAAGLHNTALMIPQLDDWKNLGRWFNSRWSWTPEEYEPDWPYEELKTADDLERVIEATDIGLDWLASDTEDDGSRPWSMQFSLQPGSGYLIKADNRVLIEEFARRYKDHEWRLHNGLHDLTVYGAMGVHIKHFADTMIQAYHLGNVPQGLKALIWRLYGIKMQSWEDLVTPPSRARMIDWLQRAWEELEEDRTPEKKLYQEPRPATAAELRAPLGLLLGGECLELPRAVGSRRTRKDGTVVEKAYKTPKKLTGEEYASGDYICQGEPRQTKWVLGRIEWKPSEAERACKRILSHSHKPTYDLWEKAETAGLIYSGDTTRRLAAALGPAPILSIANCDPEAAVQYACADADHTGRLSLGLAALREKQQAEWTIPIEDRDQ